MPELLLSVGAAVVVVLPVLAVTMTIRSPTAGVAVTVFVPLVVLNVAVPSRVTVAATSYFPIKRTRRYKSGLNS